jgi:hypothetical protein
MLIDLDINMVPLWLMSQVTGWEKYAAWQGLKPRTFQTVEHLTTGPVVIECEMDSISRNELFDYEMDICLFNFGLSVLFNIIFNNEQVIYDI